MKTSIITFILISFVFLGYSQQLLTLDAAINKTLENNFEIKISKNNAEKMQNNAIAANAGLIPRIDADAGINYSNNKIKNEIGEINEKSTYTNGGISLSYTIFNGMANINNYKILQEMAKAGQLQSQQIIESTIYRLIVAYYNIVIQYENTIVFEDMLSVSRERYEKAKVNLEFGKANGLELLTAEVDYNNDSIDYINSINSLNEYKRNLNEMMGENPETDFVVNPQIVEFQKYKKQDIKQAALENNVAYLLCENEQTQEQLNLKVAKAGFMPTLSLNSSYGYNQTVKDFGIEMDDPNRNFTSGISLRINVFDGGQKRKKVQNAKISLNNSELKIENQKLKLFTDIENSYADYLHNLRVLKTNENNLKASERNFLRSKEYYNLGQITSTQFREAQNNFSRAKINISIARVSAKIAEVELVYLSGNILK